MKKLIITMLMTIAGLTTLMAQQTHDIKRCGNRQEK